jgi:hypothetical protein
MKNKSTKVFALLLMVSLSASAQEIFKFNSSGGGFNFMVGQQGYNASPYFPDPTSKSDVNLNYALGYDSASNTLSGANFAKPTGAMMNFGFQGYGLYKSIILGGELNVGVGNASSGKQFILRSKGDSTYGTTSTQSFGGNLMFNVGMVALRKKGLIVYPLIGIGFGSSGIRMKASAASRVYPDFTNVITDANQQNMLVWTSNAVFDIGLGAQYILGKATEDNAKGFSIGFRVGYNTQFATDNIKVNQKNAIDNPDWKTSKPTLPKIGASGLYAKLLIGFGRIGENR